jgi:protein SDA1
VEGADLLAEYEARKKVVMGGGDVEEDESGNEEESGWIEVDDDEDNSEIEIDEDAGESSDEEAPELTLLEDEEGAVVAEKSEEHKDLSQLSKSERAQLKQQVSSTRIFTTAEFAKMQKLVERQQRARRDPRLAAKLKREKAKGNEFADLSDDDGDMDSDDEAIRIPGAVTPTDIMADAKRKRMSKAEKLQKVLEGRQKWEAKVRCTRHFTSTYICITRILTYTSDI